MDVSFPEARMADLANIKLRLNTHGNVVVILDMPDPKEIDEMLTDENNNTTPYGFILRKVIEQFAEEYNRINGKLRYVINNVKAD